MLSNSREEVKLLTRAGHLQNGNLLSHGFLSGVAFLFATNYMR